MNRPPPHVHGKEAVDGSSPSEGFEKSLEIDSFLHVAVAHARDMRSHRGRTAQRFGHYPLFRQSAVRPTTAVACSTDVEDRPNESTLVAAAAGGGCGHRRRRIRTHRVKAHRSGRSGGGPRGGRTADADRAVRVSMDADESRHVRVRVVSSAVTLDRMPWVPAGAIVSESSSCRSWSQCADEWLELVKPSREARDRNQSSHDLRRER
jgi:hypothetical protein